MKSKLYPVQKSLYISNEMEKALKKKAIESQTYEAEIIRDGLGRVLEEGKEGK